MLDCQNHIQDSYSEYTWSWIVRGNLFRRLSEFFLKAFNIEIKVHKQPFFLSREYNEGIPCPWFTGPPSR